MEVLADIFLLWQIIEKEKKLCCLEFEMCKLGRDSHRFKKIQLLEKSSIQNQRVGKSELGYFN